MATGGREAKLMDDYDDDTGLHAGNILIAFMRTTELCRMDSICVFDAYMFQCLIVYICVALGVLMVSTLGMRTRRPRFESRVAPLFHWIATLGKLFAHIASPVSQLQETGVQKGSFRCLSGYGD